mmetsp:Transcript_115071/g.330621  ORF Transcript_115071/g.330621 Transcript_115071/m.330621 type:complete len:457 (+) Transcript_115071:77-1447(+)
MGQCSACGHEAAAGGELQVEQECKSPRFFLEAGSADVGPALSPGFKGVDSPTGASTAATIPGSPGEATLSETSGAHLSTALSAAGDADAELDGSPEGGCGEAALRDDEVRALFAQLRVVEAAALLEQQQGSAEGGDGGGDPGLRDDLHLHLEQLSEALDVLAGHPSMSALAEGAATPAMPERLLGVPLAGTVRDARAREAQAPKAKRDVLEVKIDLDGNGLLVDAFIEFFPDGSVASEWVATDLPIPLSYMVCLANEIDLLPEIAPFMVKAEVVKQFDTNEADRIVRIVSKPPIPFVAGFEQTSTSLSFDLFDTPWRGICLVQNNPKWEAASKDQRPQWRGCPQPNPFQAGLREIDVKRVVALARPSGERGELTTIVFSAKGDLKLPRSMIPNWLISWLAQQIGKFLYQRTLARISKFDETEHGERLRNHSTSFYSDLHRRIAEFVQRERQEERNT